MIPGKESIRDALPEVPGHATPDLWIRKFPADGSLITGVHTGSTFNTIFHLKMYFPKIILGIAVGRTHIRSALMRASRVTDLRFYPDMRFDFRFGLIPITN